MICVFVGVVYCYYESTRRKYLDDQPGRLSAKERNQRNTKVRNRQKQVVNCIFGISAAVSPAL